MLDETTLKKTHGWSAEAAAHCSAQGAAFLTALQPAQRESFLQNYCKQSSGRCAKYICASLGKGQPGRTEPTAVLVHPCRARCWDQRISDECWQIRAAERFRRKYFHNHTFATQPFFAALSFCLPLTLKMNKNMYIQGVGKPVAELKHS